MKSKLSPLTSRLFLSFDEPERAPILGFPKDNLRRSLQRGGMMTGGSNQGDVERKSASRGTTRSWGTTGSGQSVSTTSGSAGSPSSRSGQAMETPVSENTFARMNRLDIQGDDAASQGAAVAGKKKKRAARATAGDKTGRGLRQFSMKVCEKVECKGRTTYNEVADELVAEFAEPNNSLGAPDQQQYDEKNIRRRVYDALNVLMAMDIISKDKKEIQWKGLPRTSLNDIEELKAERMAVKSRIEKKAAYLQELQDQYVGLQNLVKRNEELYASGNAPSGGVALPFILVQTCLALCKAWCNRAPALYAPLETRPHATVEVEISEDMQLVHFDFNSTPFELHDDSYVLKAMRFCERSDGGECSHEPASNGGEGSSMHETYQHQIQHPTRLVMGKPPSSPSIPGILKARVKNEH